jgi:dTDP-4-amino-4,6-dideoxygalactose transaminase
MHKINVSRPFLPDLKEFLPYLEQIWESKILTSSGPMHNELESGLCDYLGVHHLSLVSSGNVGLMLAMKALEVTGEVITTPFTFIATTNAILWTGAQPCFVDIEPENYNIDPEKIEAAITDKTSAILAVHCYGNFCNVDAIEKIAQKYHLKVIYDAAHVFYPNTTNSSILNRGDAAVLSFNATKTFNTFEGGAIICSNPLIDLKIKRLRNFGFVDELVIDGPGVNAKLNEFQAALGLLQLKYVDQSHLKIASLCNIYRQYLRMISGIKLLNPSDSIGSRRSYFPIFIQQDFPFTRDELYNTLRDGNIFARRYFYPLTSSQKCHSSNASALQECLPLSSRASEQVICLPLYPDLSLENQMRVIEIIKRCSLRE